MGFFSGIKKRLKKIAKLAIKTAPIWSSFIPGGTVVGLAIKKAGSFVGKAQALRSKVQHLAAVARPGLQRKGLFFGPTGGQMPSLSPSILAKIQASHRQQALSGGGQVVHAGIRGPVSEGGWGAHHRRLGGMFDRMRATPQPQRRRRRAVSTGRRRRVFEDFQTRGRFPRRRKRRAA